MMDIRPKGIQFEELLKQPEIPWKIEHLYPRKVHRTIAEQQGLLEKNFAQYEVI